MTTLFELRNESESIRYNTFYSLSGTPVTILSELENEMSYFLDIWTSYTYDIRPIELNLEKSIRLPSEFENHCQNLGKLLNSLTHFLYNQGITELLGESELELVEFINRFGVEIFIDILDAEIRDLSQYLKTNIQPTQSNEPVLSHFINSIGDLFENSNPEIIHDGLTTEWLGLFSRLPNFCWKQSVEYRKYYESDGPGEADFMTNGGFLNITNPVAAIIGVCMLAIGCLLVLLEILSPLGFSLIVGGITLIAGSIGTKDKLEITEYIDILSKPLVDIRKLGSRKEIVGIYPFGRRFSQIVSSANILVPKSHATLSPDHIGIYSGKYESVFLAASVEGYGYTHESEYADIHKQVGYKQHKGVLELNRDEIIRVSNPPGLPSPVTHHLETTIEEIHSNSKIDDLRS